MPFALADLIGMPMRMRSVAVAIMPFPMCVIGIVSIVFVAMRVMMALAMVFRMVPDITICGQVHDYGTMVDMSDESVCMRMLQFERRNRSHEQ